ncbi:hypothetical protein DFR75_107151 [Nocardia ignorata]|uniref:Uncharacterized protein n=1 Tax=Nocardia ignorata TaxID=145285 RepID=A0A4R6P3W3_NOCIG|nr:hypothetical protein DFR75_107151 [Nocardia ignorata]
MSANFVVRESIPASELSEKLPHPRFRLPLLGDVSTTAFAKPCQRLAEQARESGAVFELKMFGYPAVIVTGVEAIAFALHYLSTRPDIAAGVRAELDERWPTAEFPISGKTTWPSSAVCAASSTRPCDYGRPAPDASGAPSTTPRSAADHFCTSSIWNPTLNMTSTCAKP